MAARALTNGAGMEIVDPRFRTLGRFALRTTFRVPPRIREVLLFGGSRFCMLLQKLLVRALGGVFLVQTRFTDGPMKGQSFACRTSEKYFMLGSHLEGELQRLVIDTIKAGDVVYDVGAHAGYMALLFSTLVGTGGSVFAFEPSPANHARLRGNIDANQTPNITLVNAAVSDHEGTAFLEECGSMSAIVSSAMGAVGGISKVRTIRLDDFVYRDGNQPPTFLKVDVEGYAGPIFEGMKRVLEAERPTILCELHDCDEEEHAKRILVSCKYDLSRLDTKRKFPWRTLAVPLAAPDAKSPESPVTRNSLSRRKCRRDLDEQRTRT